MLQLPTNAPRAGRHFTKAQIADMARGGKVTVRVKSVKAKPDPLIPLIGKADAALETYILAFNSFTDANEALPEVDRGWPWASPVEELIPTLSHSDKFSSEDHIKGRFAAMRKHARAELAATRAGLRKRGLHEQIRREMLQRVSGLLKRIALLTKYEEPQKKALRAEVRRLAKVQRTVRLVEKRAAKGQAAKLLRELTNKIAQMHPTTKYGALELLSYVETRCRDDLAEYFVDGGMFEAKLQRLIGRARSFLSRKS